jgi:hypothetical protein
VGQHQGIVRQQEAAIAVDVTAMTLNGDRS